MSNSDIVVVDPPTISGSDISHNVKTPDGAINTSLDDDPLCIVGTACHLPGSIRSPSSLWDILVSQTSAQGPVPPERYNISGFYSSSSNRSGTTNVPGGYFLTTDPRSFDNAFFGINNLEATYMDPQQRKLLEVVYECLASAGASMSAVAGSATGVYVGNFSVDYQPLQTRDPDYLHRYVATGSGATIMSNRISHVFNLHGPSFTIDTACSSSIYALHQALNGIRAGDCDSAIVASSNLILSPELHIAAAKSGVLSPTGTCHTFDVSADGYGRAEGINAIYIKRLSAALRDGNPVRAIVRGSAVNASGRTPGISLPSGEQQEVVMRQAYANAGLSFAETDYVECHGTGTPVGDPIEVNAIGNCFGPREGSPLLIGSVKTNVGHSEGASGLTSVLKVVMAFENGQIPPSHGIAKLNPKLNLAERNIRVAQKVETWPRALRRASINSFGYGGANAHVILEAPESYLDQRPESSSSQLSSDVREGDEQSLVVLPVSAASSTSLATLVSQISQTVAQSHGTESLQNLAHTLIAGRDHLPHRSFLLAGLNNGLGAVRATMVNQEQVATEVPFGFVFTGQGAQYAGMAKELLFTSQHFRDTIRRLDSILGHLPSAYAPEWTIEQVLLDGLNSRINEASRSQPVCTAVQMGLVNLLRSWGANATFVVGHSSGEIAAAYTAGHLGFKQAILVAYMRGFAVGKLQTKGAMLAAGLTPEAAKLLIKEKGLEAEVRVACVNSPESVTLSGSVGGVKVLEQDLQSEKKFVRPLKTEGRAYHSHMMEEVGQLYEELLAPYFEANQGGDGEEFDEFHVFTPRAKMFSSVGHDPEKLGDVDSQISTPGYWRRNLERPVQFSAAVANLVAAANKKVHLIEVGPHSALKGPTKQICTALKVKENSIAYSSTLVREQDADVCMKTLAGTLYAHGCKGLNWGAVNGMPESGLRIVHSLAPYPWDYSGALLWSEPRASLEMRNRKNLRHELLGTLALTGNDIDYTWRNIIRLSEVAWLKDHKLEDQIVFPATGYLGLAIEAVSQVTGAKEKTAAQLGFEFRNVNISAALNIANEERDVYSSDKDMELHTTMSRRKISNANSSEDWHDFAVSSWMAGRTTLHCTGSVRVTGRTEQDDGVGLANTEMFDTWSTSRWYSKWHEEGLCFGAHFQSLRSLQTDSERSRQEAIGVTRLEPAIADGCSYPVHPITIDATLQAAILSTTAGQVPLLKTWLPVFIEEMRIQAPSTTTDEDGVVMGEIHARSWDTGLSSRSIEATLRDSHGTPLVSFRGGRIALFSGQKKVVTEEASNDDGLNLFTTRQPTLRINWKPDVLRLGPDRQPRLAEYVAGFVEQQHDDMRDDESMAVIGALLDLAGHKNPQLRVLELGGDAQGFKAEQWQSVLGKGTAFARYKSWSSADLTENGDMVATKGSDIEGPFDVVVLPRHAISKRVWDQAPGRVVDVLSATGIIISRKSPVAVREMQDAGLDTLDAGKQVLLAVKPLQTASLAGRNGLIVLAEQASPAAERLAEELAAALRQAGVREVDMIGLGNLVGRPVAASDVCISLLEVEGEFLATMGAPDMERLRIVTDTATDVVWITGAGMLGSTPDPNLTLCSGLSRALMLEQPKLRLAVVDVGDVGQLDVGAACASVLSALLARAGKDDCEFIEHAGLLHVSRFGPDAPANSLFRRRLEPKREKTACMPLVSAGSARLAIGRVGALDTLHFQQVEAGGTPPAGHVDIAVRAVSLNAKDVYAMTGRVDTRAQTTAFDFAGVVAAVGPDVDAARIAVGDRAVACAPHHLGTVVRVPVGVVHRMRDDESFTALPTLLLVYATALYALHDRAHLRAGESVLVHAGSGGLGIAAITLARRLGATVYTTAGSQAKRDYLVREMGVPPEHIFSSRDPSFVAALRHATGGRGVDVVLNSLVGDLMHESWRCLSEFGGRFVEVGKRELVDAGKLDMRVFLRGATFTAFDLSELFYAADPFHRSVWDRLLAETLDLYRTGAIAPLPTHVFSASDVTQAYRYFTSKERVGKVVISFEDANAPVPLVPTTYLSQFDPEKVYLLVGCLGGLGRSLSRWMMLRGCRHFVFVGRSGADKPSARQLVSRLEKAGATVGIVRGDVSSMADVTAAVAACFNTGRRIGGVIQAAMGLHEALFTTMSCAAWHTGIDPKWQGTWNLHNALQFHVDKDPRNEPDFFLLTSSVSGTVGTATEANYCAANGFLDAFARWRRSRGQAAVSVGLGMISEVGYLHENPDIEALLLRKGIQPLNEDEFLQVIDLALASEPARQPNESHLLTGLEPIAIRKLAAQGFDVTSHGVLVEARASILLASLLAEKDLAEGGASASGRAVAAAAAPWSKDVPAHVSAALATMADADTLHEAIVRLVKTRFSNLILMPATDISESKALVNFGLDSMIASEFRSWFWSVFRVDVPFLDIMSTGSSLQSLATFVENMVVAK